MEFRELICSHHAAARPATDRLIAETRELLRLTKPTDSLIEAVVVELANTFDASITGIAIDQWFSVCAESDVVALRVVMECDTVEVGFAGVYRAFARHAKINAVLDAVPGAKWEYGTMADANIGAWSFDNPSHPAERVCLQRDDGISWASEQEGSGSLLWKACLEAGFQPSMPAEPPTVVMV